MNSSDFASHEQATALPFAKLVQELTLSSAIIADAVLPRKPRVRPYQNSSV